MQKSDPRYGAYVRVLEAHLKPAMGCTEPIAIAYAAAVAARALGQTPQSARVWLSGNILKNAMAVTVPNTGGRKGIAAACAAGLAAGDPALELQVLSRVTAQHGPAIDALIPHIQVSLKPDARLFDLLVEVEAQGQTASARIADRHTNVVCVTQNGRILSQTPLEGEETGQNPDEALLSIEGVVDFADTCDLEDVRKPLQRQIDLNTAIAREGLRGDWGASVGRLLMDAARDPAGRARAAAAAGSDARMSGCEMPVVINAGSGNQGITVSVPLIEYASALDLPHERLLRALTVSNLIAIRLKALIGCLSAYCGAVSAGCAAGAGVCYLLGGDLYLVSHTLVNALAILSGTVCDGAKPSCAAKIACAVDAGFIGWGMAQRRKQFRDGEGIVKKGVENTILNVARLGRDGMRETDREILRIMSPGC